MMPSLSGRNLRRTALPSWSSISAHTWRRHRHVINHQKRRRVATGVRAKVTNSGALTMADELSERRLDTETFKPPSNVTRPKAPSAIPTNDEDVSLYAWTAI